jgi:antitoxin component of MazEF toxin-antitoxin module
MGFKAKIQLIKRQKSEQYYVNFPSAVAQAMEFKKGDEVEWIVKNKNALTLQRVKDQKKKTTRSS